MVRIADEREAPLVIYESLDALEGKLIDLDFVKIRRGSHIRSEPDSRQVHFERPPDTASR